MVFLPCEEAATVADSQNIIAGVELKMSLTTTILGAWIGLVRYLDVNSFRKRYFWDWSAF